MSRRPLCIILFGILAGCGHQADGSPGGDDTPGGDDSGDGSGAPDGGGAGEPDAGGDGSSFRSVEVRPGRTEDPELVKRLPIGRSESGAPRRVVMRLSPEDLPDLAPGDRLSAPAEVQVTTRCDVGQTAAGCGYNPTVAAQIILTGDPADTDAGGQASLALSDKLDLSCTAAEHHCMIVFPTAAATRQLEDGAELPCMAASLCSINLVMWAWHPDARAGDIDEVLVGENEGDFLENGIIQGDKGRLMAIRERGIGNDDRSERETTGSGALGIPTSATPIVLYSHPLKAGGEGLLKDEQFVVEAKVVTAVSARARFSTRMFLTHDPSARDGKLDKVAPDSIGEHNGTNCTDGTSPCTTRKVSVFRVQEDIAGPVYLNIVGISEVPGPGSANVSVRRADGFLRSTRYAPSLQN
jgi:hypothetical protein